MAKLKGQRKPPTAMAVVRQDLAMRYRERDGAFRDQWTATREAGGNSDGVGQLLDGLGYRRKAEALEAGEAVWFHGWEIKDHLPASAGIKVSERYALTEDNRLIFGERS